jgi:hypothetical protein
VLLLLLTPDGGGTKVAQILARRRPFAVPADIRTKFFRFVAELLGLFIFWSGLEEKRNLLTR